MIIGCEMLKDEIEYAHRKCNCIWPVLWVPCKYHNTPEKLKNVLQEIVNQCQEYSKIIFTYGACGGGTDGLYSTKADMVFVRCEDCIHMLLYSGRGKSLVQKGVIYLTDGWTKDNQSIIQQYEYTQKKYGTEMCSCVMQMMYHNFHELCVIDTGTFDLLETVSYAKKAAQVANLKQTCCKGTTELLEKLFTGCFDEEFLEYKAGQAVKKEDFIKRWE